MAKPFVIRKGPLVRELLVAGRTNVISELPELGLDSAQLHDQATFVSDFDQTVSRADENCNARAVDGLRFGQ